jgi:hypothetical protein
MVSANGFVRWKSKYWMPVSTALSGKLIGIKEVLDGVWELYYRHVLLGYFNEKTGKTYEVHNPAQISTYFQCKLAPISTRSWHVIPV